MTMNELQFGKTVAEILNHGLRLDAHTSEWLRATRERALSRQQLEHTLAPAWADNVVGHFGDLSMGLLAPIAALVIGLAVLYAWQQNQRAVEVEEIDALLLTDELPVDAYLDPRFDNWLKKPAGKQP